MYLCRISDITYSIDDRIFTEIEHILHMVFLPTNNSLSAIFDRIPSLSINKLRFYTIDVCLSNQPLDNRIKEYGRWTHKLL